MPSEAEIKAAGQAYWDAAGRVSDDEHGAGIRAALEAAEKVRPTNGVVMPSEAEIEAAQDAGRLVLRKTQDGITRIAADTFDAIIVAALEAAEKVRRNDRGPRRNVHSSNRDW